MLKLYPLYSGSSGNMYLIRSPLSSIIVDMGVSYSVLKKALCKLEMDISDINALFLTHEHSDHTKGLATFINKTNIPIYSSKGTINYIINKYNDKITTTPNFNEIKPEEKIKISDIEITPYRTSHDAIEPLGYTLKNGTSTITIATDLGVVDNNVYEHLSNSGLSVIEANYDRNLLLVGPYSYPLKCRIQSDIGHLSNDDAAHTILSLAKEGKRDFLLGHISQNNNTPEEALFKVESTLKNSGFNLDEFNIHCASRDESYEVYEL